MILTILSAALLSSASPTVLAATDAKKEKQVCRREKQIGSMVRAKKTCRTKAEWDDLAQQSRQEVDRVQRTTAFPNG